MASQDPARPNIVFILSDDQGIWALGCSGNSEIMTPNLDHLAAGGMRFENMFCASPVCSPARASLLTGRIPSQHGIHDYIRFGSLCTPPNLKNPRMDGSEIEYLAGLRGYTDFLSENGYNCALSGKWHLGKSIQPQKGFSAWTVVPWGWSDYFDPVIIRDGKPANEAGYVTDIITADALDFIDQLAPGDSPFYLSVHYTAPHSPWNKEQHPAEIFDLYASCPFHSCPDGPAHPWITKVSSRAEGEKRRELLAGYFSAVTVMDAGIGRILQKLDELSLTDNTLVIFSSDNGMNMGHHGIWGKGNGTLPQNMYDTSVKVPFMVSWKGRIPPATVSHALCSHYDFMPTLLELLGIENPEASFLPGRSFLPHLFDPDLSRTDPVIIYDEYGPVRMIRNREWKYIHRYPYGPHELYDLSNDPGECDNRYGDPACSRIIQELRGQLDNWFNHYAQPDLDGSRLPVYGKGQKDLVGQRGLGAVAFFDDIDTRAW